MHISYEAIILVISVRPHLVAWNLKIDSACTPGKLFLHDFHFYKLICSLLLTEYRPGAHSYYHSCSSSSSCSNCYYHSSSSSNCYYHSWSCFYSCSCAHSFSHFHSCSNCCSHSHSCSCSYANAHGECKFRFQTLHIFRQNRPIVHGRSWALVLLKTVSLSF